VLAHVIGSQPVFSHGGLGWAAIHIAKACPAGLFGFGDPGLGLGSLTGKPAKSCFSGRNPYYSSANFHKKATFALHFESLFCRRARRTKTAIAQTAPKEPASAGRQQGIIFKDIQVMPKVKTNSSAKKRFRVTGTGKITFQKAFKRHILTKKSKKRKRNMRKKGLVSHPNTDFVKRLLRMR
jgi:large subunit ribosomal protein L35